MILFCLLLVPIAIGLLARAFSDGKITLKEFFTMEAACLIILGGLFWFAKYQSMSDIERWNGRISGKPSGSQHCCHCRQVCQTCSSTDAKGNTTTYSCNCREECDHSADYWWSLDVTTGDNVSVRSCEPNHMNVPEAWEMAVIGEAAAVEHTYTNYLKADDGTLFQTAATPAMKARVPGEGVPRVHSYYKAQRIIDQDVNVPPAWQLYLDELNADLGAMRQIDVTMVFTKNRDPMFGEALQSKWKYGPKNALIIVVGVPDGDKIEWVKVVTISRVELLKVTLRDALIGHSVKEVKVVTDIMRKEIISKFKRTPMAEFEYLAAGATPSDGWLIFLFVFAFFLTAGLAWVMHDNDVFNEEYGRRHW